MRIVRPIVDAVGDLGTTVKNLARMREIAAILVRNGYGALVHDVPGVEAEDADAESAPPTNPERIAAIMVEMGPTYVKLGQVLSTRPDVLSDDYIRAFETLQDGVTAVPWATIEEVLLDELGPEWREGFENFEQEPLATASIAQAHTGILRDGTEVVLKVQRPGIAAQIDADLQILRFLLRRALNEWPELAGADPEGLLFEFERTMRGELDFHREAENMRRFQANYADRDDVVIPDLFEDFITGRVLCMTRLRGTPIRQAREAGFDMEVIGKRYLSVAFEMILIHGFFHGDLHPGNVFIMPDGAIGLIDFGMVGTMTDKMRMQLMTMMFSLQQQDPKTMARVLFDIAIKKDRLDYRALEAATVEVMSTHFPPGVRLRDIQMGAFTIELIQQATRFGAKIPTSYMMLLKAVVTAEGLAKTLLHEVDPIAEAMPFFAQVAGERMSPGRLQQEGMYLLLTLSSLIERLPVSVGQLLDDLDAQRISLKTVQVVSEDEHLRQHRVQTRWLLGGFAAACLVAGAVTPFAVATALLWILAVLLGLGAVWMR